MRVIVGYDGSESGRGACELAARAAWPAGTEIRIVTAYQPFTDWAFPSGEAMDARTMQTAFDALRAEAERVAQDGAARVSRSDVTATWSVMEPDRAATALVEAARAWPADLLVVGHRGRGPFASGLLGSVSAEAVDHAPCPVFVVRGVGLERVIVAEDGSAGAYAAASLVAWPIFEGSEIQVVSVSETTTEQLAAVIASAPEETLERVTDDAMSEARTLASETASRLAGFGRRVEPVARGGDPAHEIVSLATEWPARLIVMGTRGRTGLTRLLLGSVARNVLLHAPCSVLVRRRPAQ